MRMREIAYLVRHCSLCCSLLDEIENSALSNVDYENTPHPFSEKYHLRLPEMFFVKRDANASNRQAYA